MLRLLILLECDECRETWTAVQEADRAHAHAWEEEIQNLEYEAEQTGWSIYRSDHICNVCVMEGKAEQEGA